MKKNYIMFFLLAILTICISCQNNSKPEQPFLTLSNGAKVYQNEIALRFSRLKNENLISETPKKESFLEYLKPTIKEILTDSELDFEIEKCSEKWAVYSKEDYFIVCGIAMKNENLGYLFTIVFKNDSGTFESTNIQIGKKNVLGEFPEKLMPLLVEK